MEETRAEHDDLQAAERVWQRANEQLATERAGAGPACAQVGGRGVMLVVRREPGVEQSALPQDYQRILAVVRQAGGPITVRATGETLGVDVTVKGKLEPLRGKMTKLADRGWLHKRPDGRFTVRP
ncbi:hypothetical protein ACIBCU_26805 [Streptomyces sp. NPDC051064]|uniref:hypothetical protein n=1 Tax=Streptomyces sp. NPDC051064 TaxID=3365641 RepID=UPI0037AFD355